MAVGLRTKERNTGETGKGSPVFSFDYLFDVTIDFLWQRKRISPIGLAVATIQYTICSDFNFLLNLRMINIIHTISEIVR